MNLRIQSFVRSSTIAVAIGAAAMLLAATADNAAAGNMGGGVRAPSPTAAVKTSPGGFNPVTNQVRPPKKPSLAVEPCRGIHCKHGGGWH